MNVFLTVFGFSVVCVVFRNVFQLFCIKMNVFLKDLWFLLLPPSQGGGQKGRPSGRLSTQIAKGPDGNVLGQESDRGQPSTQQADRSGRHHIAWLQQRHSSRKSPYAQAAQQHQPQVAPGPNQECC